MISMILNQNCLLMNRIDLNQMVLFEEKLRCAHSHLNASWVSLHCYDGILFFKLLFNNNYLKLQFAVLHTE